MKTIYRFFLLITGFVLVTSMQVSARTITGLVYNAKENAPQANHLVYYIIPGSTDSLSTLTNSDGYFSFDLQFDYTDSVYGYIMTVDPCSGVMHQSAIYPFTSSDFMEFKVCTDSTVETNCEARFDYYSGVWTDPVNNSDGNLGDSFTIYFYDESIGDITNWYWDFGDGSSSNERNPIHTFDYSGERFVTLTVTGHDCKSSVQNRVWIDYTEPACSAWFYYDFGYNADSTSLPNDTVVNDMLTVYFYDYSMDGAPTSWKWDFGDGFTSDEQNPVHKYAAPGEYYVELYISDGAVCGSWYGTTIWVGNYEPPCQAMFGYDYMNWNDPAEPGTDSTTMDYSTLYFYDYSSGSPTHWKWDFGDGESSTDQNPWHTFAKEGEYYVSLEITGESCNSNYSMYVYAGKNPVDTIWVPAYCQAYFYPIIETNNMVSFVNQSYGSIVDYYWYFGDGTFSIEPNPVHQYQNQGEYMVTLTINTLDNCTSKFDMFVTVGDYIAEPDSVLTALFIPEINGNTVIFHDKSVGEIDNRYWDFGDGGSSTSKEPVHVYNELKTYYVTLGISNSYAVRTYTMELNLMDATFKGFFGSEDALSLYSTQHNVGVKVYPNPVKDKLTIDFNCTQNGEGEVTLLNLSGQVISGKQIKYKNGFNTVNLHTNLLEKGLYILQFKLDKQPLKTIKIVK